jgi:hypothetical protein
MISLKILLEVSSLRLLAQTGSFKIVSRNYKTAQTKTIQENISA